MEGPNPDLGEMQQNKGLSVAPKTLANFLERKTQLYEQGADARRIGQYVRNWTYVFMIRVVALAGFGILSSGVTGLDATCTYASHHHERRTNAPPSPHLFLSGFLFQFIRLIRFLCFRPSREHAKCPKIPRAAAESTSIGPNLINAQVL